MSEEQILDEIESNKEEYIEFLRGLIQTESYNPPGNEKNVALKIEKYLKNAGIKSEIYPFGENRANLIATLNDNFEGKNLLFNGHMDVVPPGLEEEWKYHPLSAVVKRKRIFGRGTVDMKGGTAAMAISLKILKKIGVKTSGNLIFNAVADEEVGGILGTKWCLDNLLKSKKCDFAVIGEPTGFNPLPKVISLGEKGRISIKIITNGISGHASVPYLGVNAIIMMNVIIHNLDKLDEYVPKIKPPLSKEELEELISILFPSREIFDRFLEEQPLLQNVIKANTHFTKNLTMIKGGIKSNVIPDHCESVIDFRLLPGQKIETLLNGLKKLINELGYQIKSEPTGLPDEVFVYIDVLDKGEASYWKDWKKSQTLKDFYNIAEQCYKKKPFYFLFPGSSDTKYYRNTNYCASTIMFGPGNASLAHSTNEYIEIQDYINAIKVYTLFAYSFLKD
ncbi:MAG: M20 family metallopeptidase [Candidatus Lokiarchaeota archaeon]|nr:M20 family metallopeptidase [Candidatus Lokiarchaeota archaeon]